MRELHALMLRAAAHQVWRMRSALPDASPATVDVIVNQAADEAIELQDRGAVREAAAGSPRGRSSSPSCRRRATSVDCSGSTARSSFVTSTWPSCRRTTTTVLIAMPRETTSPAPWPTPCAPC